MAGRGPAPKATRARRNSSPVQERIFFFTPAGQPDMPEWMPGSNNDEPIPWPTATGQWWNMWAQHPMAEEFTESDWLFLRDTAVLHGMFWHGDTSVAAELRLRVAKFGATPEDRARLRVQFAVADEAEAKAKSKKGPAAPKVATKKRPDPRSHLSSVI